VELHPRIRSWRSFFPDVYRKEVSMKPSDNQYCKFNNQTLTLFTSSLYVAALISSICASSITRRFGRRTTMICGGVLFLRWCTHQWLRSKGVDAYCRSPSSWFWHWMCQSCILYPYLLIITQKRLCFDVEL
jgi:MFS family permease